METVIEPNIDVVKRGVLIGFVTKLSSGSNEVSIRRNLNRSLGLPTSTIRVVSIPQMLFINLIMAIHGNKTVDRPLMNSMATRRCKNANVVHSRGGY